MLKICRTKRKYYLVFSGIVLLAAVLAVIDLCMGSVSLGIGQVVGAIASEDDLLRQIVFQIRLPRVLCALMAGGALALSGSQMQAVFRNPLADPHILGISSGAAFGAALAAGSSSGSVTLTMAAFVGAAVASAGVVAFSSRFKVTASLLVFGVLAGFIFSALTTLCQYFSPEESLKLYNSWVSGSYVSCGWNGLLFMAVSLAAGLCLAMANARGLDMVLFGDDFAQAGRASLGRIRMSALLSSCIMTAAVTAFCGPIGFVGIIAPHLTKAVLGTSVHRKILIPVMFLGSAISLFADILAQCFTVPLPVGCTMALSGIPVIMYMLIGKRLW